MKANGAYTIFNQKNMETVETRKAGKKIETGNSCLYHNLRESIIYKLQGKIRVFIIAMHITWK